MSEKLNNNTSEFSKHETEHKSVEFGDHMTLRQFRETYPEDTSMCFADESYSKVMKEFRENLKNNSEEFEAEANRILEQNKKEFTEETGCTLLPRYDVDFNSLPELSREDEDNLRKNDEDSFAQSLYTNKADIAALAQHSLAEKELDKHQDEIMVFARPSLSDVINNGDSFKLHL